MRAIDLMNPYGRQIILDLYLNRAIASLPNRATKEQQIAEAVRIGAVFKLEKSDFEGQP